MCNMQIDCYYDGNAYKLVDHQIGQKEHEVQSLSLKIGYSFFRKAIANMVAIYPFVKHSASIGPLKCASTHSRTS